MSFLDFLLRNGIIFPFGFFFVLAVIRAMGTSRWGKP